MERALSDRSSFELVRAEDSQLSGAVFGPASASVAERSPIPEAPLEIEIRFFVTSESLASHAVLSGIEPFRIRQDYFPDRRISSLARELRLSERFDMADEITSARLRRIERGEEAYHCIDFKGSKRGGEEGKITRLEISLPLDKSQYRALSKLATAGSLEKMRYEVEGMLICPSNGPVAVTAQIDLLKKAGKDREKIKADFATVDVELPSVAAAEALRGGLHSFDFLRGNAVDLTMADRELSDAMSTRRLAKDGVTRRTRKAIEELRAVAGR